MQPAQKDSNTKNIIWPLAATTAIFISAISGMILATLKINA